MTGPRNRETAEHVIANADLFADGSRTLGYGQVVAMARWAIRQDDALAAAEEALRIEYEWRHVEVCDCKRRFADRAGTDCKCKPPRALLAAVPEETNENTS